VTHQYIVFVSFLSLFKLLKSRHYSKIKVLKIALQGLTDHGSNSNRPALRQAQCSQIKYYMQENFECQKSPKKEFIPTEDRCAIQRQLIKDFCESQNKNDAKQRNICASNWVEKYADNFDQLNKELIRSYKDTQDEKEREIILDKIQEELETLNQING